MTDTSSQSSRFDEEWEADAEDRLAVVDYDTELGKKLGRDAQRLAAGEITQTEFYERYHEDVVSEFGMDKRATLRSSSEEFEYDTESGTDGTDPPDGNGQLPGVPGEDDASRRSVLKTAGAIGAAAVGLGGAKGAASSALASEDTDDEDDDIQWGMAINQNNCIACLNCVEACNRENSNTADALWMYVHRYVENEYTDDEEYLTRPCQHCSDAPCTAACPVASRHTRDEDGVVLTDYETCIGCRYCEVACPYGVNYLQWATPEEKAQFASSGIPLDENGDIDEDGLRMDSDDPDIDLDSDDPDIHLESEDIVLDSESEVRYDTKTKDGIEAAGPPDKGIMGKCTFCVHRQDSEHEELRGTTACEDVCPTDAIHFGNMNDPESAPREHLDQISENESTFRLLEEFGTEPNIVYVGNEPSPDATPVDGPRTLEDMDRDLQLHRTDRNPISYSSEDE